MDDIGDKRSSSGMRPSDIDPGAVVGSVLGSAQHPQTAEIEALFTGQIEPARAQAVIRALRRESMYMAVFEDVLSLARDPAITGTGAQMLTELEVLYHAREAGGSDLQRIVSDETMSEWVKAEARATLAEALRPGKIDPQ